MLIHHVNTACKYQYINTHLHILSTQGFNHSCFSSSYLEAYLKELGSIMQKGTELLFHDDYLDLLLTVDEQDLDLLKIFDS